MCDPNAWDIVSTPMLPSQITKREKQLYRPITDLLAHGHGMRVWEQATIRAGESGTRTADHVAWRWEGDQLQAIAVEVKPGPADVALAQAVAYSTGFDRVFVAAEEAFNATGYLADVFSGLGLGYIRVDPDSAVIERDATESPFVVQAVRSENLARVRLRHLFDEALLGEPVRFGTDRRGPIWAVTGTTGEWQLCGEVVTYSDSTWVSLLAESKEVALSATDMDAPSMSALASEIAPSSELELRERRHNGYRPVYSELLTRWCPGDGSAKLDKLLKYARTLSAPRVGPHFKLRLALWPHDAPLTEGAARKELNDALNRLRRIRALLSDPHTAAAK